jgi:hypothetical protein
VEVKQELTQIMHFAFKAAALLFPNEEKWHWLSGGACASRQGRLNVQLQA